MAFTSGKLNEKQRANYQSVLAAPSHYEGKNFKLNKGQAKARKKASKALARDEFARTHRFVQGGGGKAGQRGHWEKVQPGQAPSTVLG